MSKDAQIKSMEETIQSLEAKNKAKDLLTMNLQDKIKELESQLLVERKITRQHVDNKIAQDVEQKQQQQQSLKMEERNTHLRSPITTQQKNSDQDGGIYIRIRTKECLKRRELAGQGKNNGSLNEREIEPGAPGKRRTRGDVTTRRCDQHNQHGLESSGDGCDSNRWFDVLRGGFGSSRWVEGIWRWM
ncbi:hypothetical protein ZWY2020_006839 [Hordeum vulgare]|nr:hypothetical protein ZWY2020_006839 [Hordeum vulgare]